MEWMLFFAAVLMVVCGAALWAAVNYSMPAPAWYEEEERNRRNWYK